MDRRVPAKNKTPADSHPRASNVCGDRRLVDVAAVDLAGFDGQVQQRRDDFLRIGLVFRRRGSGQFGLGGLDLGGEVGMVEFGERRGLLGEDGETLGRNVGETALDEESRPSAPFTVMKPGRSVVMNGAWSSITVK